MWTGRERTQRGKSVWRKNRLNCLQLIQRRPGVLIGRQNARKKNGFLVVEFAGRLMCHSSDFDRHLHDTPSIRWQMCVCLCARSRRLLFSWNRGNRSFAAYSRSTQRFILVQKLHKSPKKNPYFFLHSISPDNVRWKRPPNSGSGRSSAHCAPLFEWCDNPRTKKRQFGCKCHFGFFWLNDRSVWGRHRDEIYFYCCVHCKCARVCVCVCWRAVRVHFGAISLENYNSLL